MFLCQERPSLLFWETVLNATASRQKKQKYKLNQQSNETLKSVYCTQRNMEPYIKEHKMGNLVARIVAEWGDNYTKCSHFYLHSLSEKAGSAVLKQRSLQRTGSCVHTKLTLASRTAIVKQGMIPPVEYYSYVGQGIQSSHQKMYFWTKDTFEQNYEGLVLCSFLSSISTQNLPRNFTYLPILLQYLQ